MASCFHQYPWCSIRFWTLQGLLLLSFISVLYAKQVSIWHLFGIQHWKNIKAITFFMHVFTSFHMFANSRMLLINFLFVLWDEKHIILFIYRCSTVASRKSIVLANIVVTCCHLLFGPLQIFWWYILSVMRLYMVMDLILLTNFIMVCLFCYPPPHKSSGGVLCYTLRNFECPYILPSALHSVL